MKIEDVISLGISADSSGAARELKKLNALLRSVKDPTEQLERTQQLLNASMRAGEIGYGTFADALAKASVQATKQVSKIDELRSAYDRLQASAKRARDEQNRTAGLKTQSGIQATRDQTAEGRAALAERFEEFQRNRAAERRTREQSRESLTSQRDSAYVAQFNNEQRSLASLTAQRNAAYVAQYQNELRSSESLTAQRNAAFVAQFQEELRSRNSLNAQRNAAFVAQFQEELRSRDSLRNQRGQAFGEADRLNVQQNPAESFRRGVANLDALRQSGLSNEAYDAAMQDLVDRTNQMDQGLQRANRAQEQYAASQQRGVEYMRQFENSHQALNRRLAEARTLFVQGALSADQYDRAVGQIRRRASLTYQALAAMRGAILTVVGPLATLYVGFTALSKSIKLSADLEKSTAKLKVFLGSAYEAEQVLSNLRALSVQGVGFTASTKSATTLLQFSVEAKDLMPSLEALAEITAGDNERLENLSLAFAQSAAAGRLMGQELLQMVNAGFNPLKIISEQTGKSMADLKDEMSKGLIPFEMVKKAFIDATSEGGKFDGLLEEIAGTSSGKLSRMVAKLQELGTAFGQAISPETNSILDALNASLAETAQLLDQIAKNRKGGEGEGGLGAKNAGVLEDYNIRQDSIAAREALEKGDAAEATKRLDRINARNVTPGIVGSIGGLSEDEISRIEALREAMEDLEKLRERAKKGDAVTPAEKAYLDFLDKQERSLKKVNDAKFGRLQERYKEQMEAAGKLKGDAKTKAEMEAFIGFGNTAGQGFLNDAEVARLKDYTEKLAKLNTEAKRLDESKERIREATEKPLEKVRDGVDDLRFGKDAATGESVASRYREIAEMLSPKDKQTFEKIIADSSSSDEINKKFQASDINRKDATEAIERANELYKLREKLKKLTEEEDKKEAKTKEDEAAQKKIKEEIDGLKSKLQYQNDLLKMTKEEARVKELMRSGKLGEADAKAQARAEKELKIAENMAKLRGDATQTNRGIDPYNGLVDEMAQLELQKQKGLLDPGVYEQRRKQLMDENVKTQEVSAAPSITKGSQEAFKALTGQSVDKINQQLKESKQQTVLLGKTPEILRRTNELLEELNDNKPTKLGP